MPSATAILDRFLHHASILQITGRSYRLRNRQPQADGPVEPKPANVPTGSTAKKRSKQIRKTDRPNQMALVSRSGMNDHSIIIHGSIERADKWRLRTKLRGRAGSVASGSLARVWLGFFNAQGGVSGHLPKGKWKVVLIFIVSPLARSCRHDSPAQPDDP